MLSLAYLIAFAFFYLFHVNYIVVFPSDPVISWTNHFSNSIIMLTIGLGIAKKVCVKQKKDWLLDLYLPSHKVSIMNFPLPSSWQKMNIVLKPFLTLYADSFLWKFRCRHEIRKFPNDFHITPQNSAIFSRNNLIQLCSYFKDVSKMQVFSMHKRNSCL